MIIDTETLSEADSGAAAVCGSTEGQSGKDSDGKTSTYVSQ
jgi:hypothetical protein